MTENHGCKFTRLDKLFSKIGRYMNRTLSQEEDLSPKQYFLLRTLLEKRKSTVSELANHLGLSTSATTIALNRLVKNGYIIRTRDDVDRRVVWVEISEKAIALTQKIIEMRKNVLIQLLAHLTPDEIEQLSKLVDKMTINLD